MSRYPGNPYWHQPSDLPIALLSQGDWDEAAAGGHLTPEHYLDRLERMLAFSLGNGADLGYSADGFFNALVSDGFRLKQNVRLFVHPNDHNPPHAHLEVRSERHGRIRLSLADGQLLPGDVVERSVKKHLEEAQRFIRDNADMLAAAWNRTRPTER